MLNKLIELSLRNRFAVLVLAGVIMIIGGYLGRDMDVDVFPDLTAPTVTILTEAHGMATEEVEYLVTYPIESALNGSPNMRRIRSSSARGISIVWAEFEWGTEIYRARQIVSEKLGAVSELLPEGVGNPTLSPISSIMGEIMLISLSSDSLSAMELRSLADWQIRQRLLAVSGVSQVIAIGGGYKQYQILASQEKMRNLNVSLEELETAARGANLNAAGGIINDFGNQYVIRGEGKSRSLSDLGSAVIKLEDGVPIHIEDVAEVRIGESPRIGDGSYMGEEAVILTILKQPEVNTLELTGKIDETLTELQKQIPASVKIDSHIFRQADFIAASVRNLQRTLLEGAIFVCIVLFFFLMNWRTTVISLIAIPLSLLVTIIAMELLGLNINTMSLGGMAIAIGALVDDAIIDVENIFKRLRANSLLPSEKKKALIPLVMEASQEIRNSIFVATLIVAVSFLPLFFLEGMEGRLLRPLGISFIIALGTSLVVAVTVTPVLSSFFLSNDKRLQKQAEGSWMERGLGRIYARILALILNRPLPVILAATLVFGVSVWLFGGMGRNFLPEFNEGSLVISVVGPPGMSLEESNRAGRKVELALLEMEEIELVSRRTGRAELDEHAQGVNSSEIEVPFKLKERTQEAFMEAIRERLSQVPGVNITIGQPIAHRIDHMLSGTRANIAIKVFGPDLNRLFAISNQIKSQIEPIEGLVDLSVEQQIEVPQIRIKPRRQLLARYGIRVDQLMKLVDIGLAGESVSQVYEGQRSFNLVLRFEENDRSNLELIRNIRIDAAGGEKIPLHYVAEVSVSGSPYTVNRENVQRKVVVSANVAGRDLRTTVNEIREKLGDELSLPQDYRIEFGGQFESEERASRLLFWTSAMALFIIFLLLLAEFQGFKVTLVVLLNLPLGLVGGIFAVYFSSGVISIASLIGFISLFGIATRNGILLVSRYQHLLSEGSGLREALIQGSLDRLNPILMTAMTTGLALIPLALAGNQAGNEIQSPMAIVILGGLLSATFLNLGVIPAVFYLMNRKNYAASK